jgi:hypothetical protein
MARFDNRRRRREVARYVYYYRESPNGEIIYKRYRATDDSAQKRGKTGYSWIKITDEKDIIKAKAWLILHKQIAHDVLG